jgi:ferredoxin
LAKTPILWEKAGGKFMAYKITEECISCGACEPECPNQAISEGETIYVIDPNKCTECVGSHESSRCAEVCPVDCCEPDPEHKESREQLLEKWKGLHPGETPTVT